MFKAPPPNLLDQLLMNDEDEDPKPFESEVAKSPVAELPPKLASPINGFR